MKTITPSGTSLVYGGDWITLNGEKPVKVWRVRRQPRTMSWATPHIPVWGAAEILVEPTLWERFTYWLQDISA